VPKAKAIVATAYANGWRFSMAIICHQEFVTERKKEAWDKSNNGFLSAAFSRGKSSMAII